ncbi:hypothetical protein ACFTXM_30770 [Streptomyces sp. NPDC056930]|uniref:hypothetical protein n=1 Tax=Streptomyces sp. NPDC056930 TaxID=3345967 RepID=UPI003626A0E9
MPLVVVVIAQGGAGGGGSFAERIAAALGAGVRNRVLPQIGFVTGRGADTVIDYKPRLFGNLRL